MSFVVSSLKATALAAAIAVTTYLVSPTESGQRKLLESGVALVVTLVLFWIVRSAGRLRSRLAVAIVRAGVYALHEWGSAVSSQLDGDTLWDWFTDQLVVAQRRYAFSVGCIAFQEDRGGRLQCLMVRREIKDVAGLVLLWPGGRIRGSLEDFEGELRRMVRSQTGCTVELLTTGATNARFKTPLFSYDPRTKESDLENSLLQPPILVMQQNRIQSHDVPGHIDLLYLARVGKDEEVSHPGLWLDIDGMSTYDKRELWLDTRHCVTQAAQVYADVTGTGGATTSLGQPPGGSQ